MRYEQYRYILFWQGKYLPHPEHWCDSGTTPEDGAAVALPPDEDPPEVTELPPLGWDVTLAGAGVPFPVATVPAEPPVH